VTAGYSKTLLVKKLGIKLGFRVHVRRPPEQLDSNLRPLLRDVEVKKTLRGSFDFIHAFETRRRELDRVFPRLKTALRKSGALWISWPKQFSGRQTDLSGGEVRSIDLGHGLVDIKVCAVDDTWSGLKFVYRKVDR
jgi:hypothetical protein